MTLKPANPNTSVFESTRSGQGGVDHLVGASKMILVSEQANRVGFADSGKTHPRLSWHSAEGW